MKAFLLSLAVSSPLIALYHLLTRLWGTGIFILLLNLGIAPFAGAMYGFYAHRQGEDPSISKFLTER